MDSFSKLDRAVTHCERCPRLRSYGKAIAQEKKREFKNWDYWGKPVPGFGDPKARIWILGLAPAAHGGNRTGRMFTGDSSGNWLYRALYRTGFANQETSESIHDGLELNDVYISAAARCAPPDNKPLPIEISHCSEYLNREFELLNRVNLFIALGNIGYQSTCRLLARQGVTLPKPKPKFGHNLLYRFGQYAVLCSYHPSRQNTQTGTLTDSMWMAIFKRARGLLEDQPSVSKSTHTSPDRSSI